MVSSVFWISTNKTTWCKDGSGQTWKEIFRFFPRYFNPRFLFWQKGKMRTRRLISYRIIFNSCTGWWWCGCYKVIRLYQIWIIVLKAGSNTIHRWLILCQDRNCLGYKILFDCYILSRYDNNGNDDDTATCLVCQVWFDRGWLYQETTTVRQVWLLDYCWWIACCWMVSLNMYDWFWCKTNLNQCTR